MTETGTRGPFQATPRGDSGSGSIRTASNQPRTESAPVPDDIHPTAEGKHPKKERERGGACDSWRGGKTAQKPGVTALQRAFSKEF